MRVGVKGGHRRPPQLPGIGQTKRAQNGGVDDVEQIGLKRTQLFPDLRAPGC
jgi:hypothetical protein